TATTTRTTCRSASGSTPARSSAPSATAVTRPARTCISVCATPPVSGSTPCPGCAATASSCDAPPAGPLSRPDPLAPRLPPGRRGASRCRLMRRVFLTQWGEVHSVLAERQSMSQTVRGVIARSKGAEVELVDVVVPDPGPNDVIVRVQACGVCHTDLAYRDGGINDEYPFLLGHEAAGIVETVGDRVTHVAEGDFVVLNWRAVC